ncbi:hypothetical protein Taro_047778 [Colocasia esculenta]|uniref:HD domain-containing protein n=1 Tax=Colocasia esculenta TaxID=4460 RepID=A0A843X1M7_COLES|nr:hypothetical protein [Colocasia esculenta]
MYKKIQRGDFKCPPWFSSDACRLVTKLIETSWFKKGFVPSAQPVEEDEEDTVSKNWCKEKPESLNAFHIISLSPLFEDGSVHPEQRCKAKDKFPTIPTSHYPPSFTSPGAAERWCFFPQKRPSTDLLRCPHLFLFDLPLEQPRSSSTSSALHPVVLSHHLSFRPLLSLRPFRGRADASSVCMVSDAIPQKNDAAAAAAEYRLPAHRDRPPPPPRPPPPSIFSPSAIASRVGWVRHGIREPESVVDHMHRMGVMALISSDLPGVDRERLGVLKWPLYMTSQKVGSRFSIVAIGMTPRLLFLLEYQFAHTVSSPICGHQLQGAPSEFYGARKWSRGYGSLSLYSNGHELL